MATCPGLLHKIVNFLDKKIRNCSEHEVKIVINLGELQKSVNEEEFLERHLKEYDEDSNPDELQLVYPRDMPRDVMASDIINRWKLEPFEEIVFFS